MTSIGLEPGFAVVMIAGGIEPFGGMALVLGVITRPIALAAGLLMLIAMSSVHWSKGFFANANGYEFA